MKKIFVLALPLCAALVFFGCASKPPASGGMPPNIANARRNAPEDVIVGIGGGVKMGTSAESRNFAATRARAEISNTMDSIVKNMVRDYTASSEVDPQAALAFQENITVTLSKSNISGAVVFNEEPDKDGQWWCVMHLSKANVVKEISQAQAAARLAVPAMASFDAEKRMNEAFEQARREGW
jgi:nitroimidazol reductase NimA-like FMN-containing flavoprotein (pyridoxamine 5'-phosphate oxidase superfamily)